MEPVAIIEHVAREASTQHGQHCSQGKEEAIAASDWLELRREVKRKVSALDYKEDSLSLQATCTSATTRE